MAGVRALWALATAAAAATASVWSYGATHAAAPPDPPSSEPVLTEPVLAEPAGAGPAALEPPRFPPPPPKSTPWQPPIGQMPPEVVQAAIDARLLPLPERMTAVSQAMLGRSYVSDPLGEGRGLDADPLVRYDVFDCLTFIEEVLALSLGADPTHAAEVRNALRYGDAAPAYATRRHFMELQWIPGNIRDGWIRDTTREYGETIHLEREVTPATWRAWGRRKNFALADDELPMGTITLEVLPIDTAIAVYDRIRPGSILLTVREDHAWIPIWVSHVGLVIPSDRPMVRHATRMGLRTRDHTLLWYLEHLRDYPYWKALGVSILEPVEQHPRRRPPDPAPAPDDGASVVPEAGPQGPAGPNPTTKAPPPGG